MAHYVMERDAARVENAFGVFVDGKNIGWFATPDAANNFVQQCLKAEQADEPRIDTPAEKPQVLHLDARIPGESTGQHFEREEEVTTDPHEKLRRSIKFLRQRLVAESEAQGVDDIVDAFVDVAAHVLMTQSRTADQLERIANAVVAQTKVMCTVYSQGLTPEEMLSRLDEAKEALKE